MPLTRFQVQLMIGGTPYVLEVEPFTWPRNAWEPLELRVTRETGWRDLTGTVVAVLRSSYNGARGQVFQTMGFALVQYVEGTGGNTVPIEDWRGNTGSFQWSPNDGLDVEEIQGAHEPEASGYFTGTLRFWKAA